MDTVDPTKDVRNLSREELRSQARSIIGNPGSSHEMVVAGIVALCDVRQGDIVPDNDRVAVEDAEEFFAYFGAPVTHERAQRIFAGTEEAKGGEFAHQFDDELERSIERVLEHAAEIAMENYYGI